MNKVDSEWSRHHKEPRKMSQDKHEEKMDNVGVDHFAMAMKAKLTRKRRQGYAGWHNEDECNIQDLEKHLWRHIQKGTLERSNLVDISNFCMMIWNRKQSDILK